MSESTEVQMTKNVQKSSNSTNPVAGAVNQQSAKKSASKMSRNEVSGNWSSLANSILPKKPKSPSKKNGKYCSTRKMVNSLTRILFFFTGALNKNTVIALDCEMVGIGVNGRDHMLARVSIVNENGDILLDKYVKPTQTVIDYRTKYSGITPIDLISAHDFREVQSDVVRIKNGRILVGHALHNDMKALKLEHPKRFVLC